MKFSTILIQLLLLFMIGNRAVAQCNDGDLTDISIGQVVLTPAACPSSGTIRLQSVTGGGGEYLYEITNGPVIRIVQSQSIFNALPGGVYTVRVSSCTGKLKDTIVTVPTTYVALNGLAWNNSIRKLGGFNCGFSNDGIYKIGRPSNPGGTAPYRFQISPVSDFTGVPFQAAIDSCTFYGLSASTVYYIRVTDACNNFVTTAFISSNPSPAEPLAVPSFVFGQSPDSRFCNGWRTLDMYMKDSATGANYTAAQALSQSAFWAGTGMPTFRITVEEVATGNLIADRTLYLQSSGSFVSVWPVFQWTGSTYVQAGSGGFIYGLFDFSGNVPWLRLDRVPPGQIRVKLHFPGGVHCGTTIPAYVKSADVMMGSDVYVNPKILNLEPNCDISSGTFVKVYLNKNYATGRYKVVSPSPVYKELNTQYFSSYNDNFAAYYNGYVAGNTYRIIVIDDCGIVDSMDMVYQPGSGTAPAPTMSLNYKANFKCPANPLDSIYNVIVEPLPAGYQVYSMDIAGFTGAVQGIPNYNGTGNTAYQLSTMVPPGRYDVTIGWASGCQLGTTTQTIRVYPATAPVYRRGINLVQNTTPPSCFTEGATTINVNAFLTNVNTNYTLGNLRLTAVPNAFVFPITDLRSNNITNLATPVGSLIAGTVDSFYTDGTLSGIKINTGQQGTYTFAIDIRCPDGTVVETITRTIVVNATTGISPISPDLKYTTALICDPTPGSMSELKINMSVLGGTAPFVYEYKLETDNNFIRTNNNGAANLVSIYPAPPAGTIYDIRVTDACGRSSTAKASVGTLDGNFFIYNYPGDCYTNPFSARVGTSLVTGAYYTWRRNGVVIAQGFNVSYVDILGITVDVITVEINVYNCYIRTASRTVVASNPCSIIVLPVKNLQFTATRISEETVQLSWKTDEEKNVSHYTIEKSSNGLQFKPAGRVAANNTNAISDYGWKDDDTASTIFYRLRIVDLNGKENYSTVVKVMNRRQAQLSALQVLPNPAHDYVIIRMNADKKTAYSAKVFDAKGQLVKELNLTADELVAGKRVSLSGLPDGSYFISLNDRSDVVASAAFVKQ